MVLFSAEIKVLGMERNFARIFYINNKKFLEPRSAREGHLGGHNPPGCAPLSWHAHVGCTHLVAPLMTLGYYKITLFQKNKGERIIAIHEIEPPPTPGLHRGGQIWSPFWAPERGIFDLRHHQPSFIANSMMLPTGSQ